MSSEGISLLQIVCPERRIYVYQRSIWAIQRNATVPEGTAHLPKFGISRTTTRWVENQWRWATARGGLEDLPQGPNAVTPWVEATPQTPALQAKHANQTTVCKVDANDCIFMRYIKLWTTWGFLAGTMNLERWNWSDGTGTVEELERWNWNWNYGTGTPELISEWAKDSLAHSLGISHNFIANISWTYSIHFNMQLQQNLRAHISETHSTVFHNNPFYWHRLKYRYINIWTKIHIS